MKIGDRVKLKTDEKFIGYVSHIHKGHLFVLEDPEISVHIGHGERIVFNESQLEIITE